MTKDEVRGFVTESFANRNRNPPEPPGDETIVALTRGLLQLRNDPLGDGLAAALTHLFGTPTVPEQVAGKVVDWYLDGRRNLPPYPDRVHLPHLLAQQFEGNGVPAPPAEALDALADVEVGILRDRYPDAKTVANLECTRVVAAATMVGSQP